jgi:hypothetical protein
MTESFELSANMVRPGTGLHADQTARNVHRVLADMMPIVAMVDGIDSRDMGRAPCAANINSLRDSTLPGQEHGRAIPLADIRSRAEVLSG